jgi:hypothetical protein
MIADLDLVETTFAMKPGPAGVVPMLTSAHGAASAWTMGMSKISEATLAL